MPQNVKQHEATEAEREAVVKALNDCFTHRHHSVARYMLDAGAYVAPGDEELHRAVREIADWDKAMSEDLADAIESLEGIPQVEPYSHKLAELNYLSLRYLAGVLIGLLEQQSRECAKAIALAERLYFPSVLNTFGSIRSFLDAQIPRLRLLLEQSSKSDAERS